MRKILLLSSVATAFNPERCPVVLVAGEKGGIVRMNRDTYDADPEAFELIFEGDVDEYEAATKAGEEPKPVASATLPPVTTAPPAGQESTPNVSYLVSKEGKGANVRFFVTVNDAKAQGVEGIEDSGYATEPEAWAAIMTKNSTPAG